MIAADPLDTSSIRYPPVPAASVKAFVVVVSPMFIVPAVTSPSSVTVRGAVNTLFRLRLSPATLMTFGDMPPSQFPARLVFPGTSVHTNVAALISTLQMAKHANNSTVTGVFKLARNHCRIGLPSFALKGDLVEFGIKNKIEISDARL